MSSGTTSSGKDGLSINEREAEHVRLIYRAFLDCGSLYGTVKAARAAGIRGKLGGQVSAESVKKILTRPIYIGYNTRLGEMIPGTHEPIIEREMWDEVQRRLKEARCDRASNQIIFLYSYSLGPTSFSV